MKILSYAFLSVLSLSFAACASSQSLTTEAKAEGQALVDKAQEALEEGKEALDENKVLVSQAVAELQTLSGSEVSGTVSFSEYELKVEGQEAKRSVTVSYEVKGLGPNEVRGFHVHEHGDCSSPDGMSAGGHFNPHDHEHGAMEADDSHVGDLGNIQADEFGVAKGTKVLLTKLTLEEGLENNVVGKSVIVHEKADDLMSQPTGDAGGRVACGVIVEN